MVKTAVGNVAFSVNKQLGMVSLTSGKEGDSFFRQLIVVVFDSYVAYFCHSGGKSTKIGVHYFLYLCGLIKIEINGYSDTDIGLGGQLGVLDYDARVGPFHFCQDIQDPGGSILYVLQPWFFHHPNETFRWKDALQLLFGPGAEGVGRPS